MKTSLAVGISILATVAAFVAGACGSKDSGPGAPGRDASSASDAAEGGPVSSGGDASRASDACPPVTVCTGACTAGRHNVTTVVDGCPVTQCCALDDAGADVAAPDGGAEDGGAEDGAAGFACGTSTCDPVSEFCMDSVSAAGEAFHCAELPAVCPCPATCASLLAAYSATNTQSRLANSACLFGPDAAGSNAIPGPLLPVPLTCSTGADGGLTLRGDTFPCGEYSQTIFCLSQTEYCYGLGFYLGGVSYSCERAPSPCLPPSCACLYDAGTIGNPPSAGSSSSSGGPGPPEWTCADDGGIHVTETLN